MLQSGVGQVSVRSSGCAGLQERISQSQMAPPVQKSHAEALLLLQAGEGEDGRLKSAIGIGSLLMDGLGDTIRVSLTEDPEYEIEPCR